MFPFVINFIILEKSIELLVFSTILILSVLNYIYQTFQKYFNKYIILDKDHESNLLKLLSENFSDDVIHNSIEALKYTIEEDILLIIDFKNNTEKIYYVKSKELMDRHQGLLPTYLFNLCDLDNKIYKIEICRTMIPNKYILYNKSYQIYKNNKYFHNLNSDELEIKNKFLEGLDKNIAIKIEELKNN